MAAVGPSGPFSNALAELVALPSTVALLALGTGPLRLMELLDDDAAIDEEAFASALRELDVEGLIARRVDPGPPLRVLYELTERGAALAPALDTLARWIRDRTIR